MVKHHLVPLSFASPAHTCVCVCVPRCLWPGCPLRRVPVVLHTLSPRCHPRVSHPRRPPSPVPTVSPQPRCPWCPRVLCPRCCTPRPRCARAPCPRGPTCPVPTVPCGAVPCGAGSGWGAPGGRRLPPPNPGRGRTREAPGYGAAPPVASPPPRGCPVPIPNEPVAQHRPSRRGDAGAGGATARPALPRAPPPRCPPRHGDHGVQSIFIPRGHHGPGGLGGGMSPSLG